jgi:hypothetical protein
MVCRRLTGIGKACLPRWLRGKLLRLLYTKPDGRCGTSFLRDQWLCCWHRWHGWHRRHRRGTLSEASGLGLDGGWQEPVDTSRLWIKRRWLESIVASCLYWHRLEWCSWWVCEGTAILREVWLETCLHRLLETCLHRLLKTCLHWLLKGCKAGLLRHLRWRRRYGIEAGWLRHHAILLISKASILLRHTCHLLLHTLHVLHILHLLHALSRWCHLGKHVGVVTGKLGLQRRRRAECALLRILRSRRRPLWGWGDNATCTLLLRG